MIFAAKEAVEKRSRNRGRQEGIEEGRTKGHQEGRQAERERISKALAELGESLTPRQARIIAGESDKD